MTHIRDLAGVFCGSTILGAVLSFLEREPAVRNAAVNLLLVTLMAIAAMGRRYYRAASAPREGEQELTSDEKLARLRIDLRVSRANEEAALTDAAHARAELAMHRRASPFGRDTLAPAAPPRVRAPLPTPGEE